jgi:hypothetical protein
MRTLPRAVEEIVHRYLRRLDELAPGVVEGVCLIGSVARDDFHAGASDVVNAYWRPWLARARRPLSKLGVAALGAWAPAWGVLGVARQRFTIDTGRITSKLGAGTYARELFPSRWHRIIEECIRIRTDGAGPSRYGWPPTRRRDALDFMEYVIAQELGPER